MRFGPCSKGCSVWGPRGTHFKHKGPGSITQRPGRQNKVNLGPGSLPGNLKPPPEGNEWHNLEKEECKLEFRNAILFMEVKNTWAAPCGGVEEKRLTHVKFDLGKYRESSFRGAELRTLCVDLLWGDESLHFFKCPFTMTEFSATRLDSPLSKPRWSSWVMWLGIWVGKKLENQNPSGVYSGRKEGTENPNPLQAQLAHGRPIGTKVRLERPEGGLGWEGSFVCSGTPPPFGVHDP